MRAATQGQEADVDTDWKGILSKNAYENQYFCDLGFSS